MIFSSLKIINIKKNHFAPALGKIAVIFILAMIILGAGSFSYAAGSGKTVKLSGSKTEDIYVEPGTSLVILNGLDMAENTVLTIDSEATIEIADGSNNHLDIIEADGPVNITGGGELNLVNGFIGMTGSVIFNHTGKIKSSGPIICLEGNLTVNSGTIEIKNEQESSSGISALGGNLAINGGNVKIDSDGVAIASYENVIINGGEVDVVSSSDCAVLSLAVNSGTIEVAPSINSQENLEVVDQVSEFGTFHTMASGEEVLLNVKLDGPPDEKAIELSLKEFEEESNLKIKAREEEKQTEENTDTKEEKTEKSQKISSSTIIIIVIVICVAVAAVIAFLVTRKKK